MKQNGGGGKRIVLFVSFGWSNKKGLDTIIELANKISNQYQIIVVGTDQETDKMLPENVMSIHRTQNQKELAALYTKADVFVNPTKEEVLGMVNIEALACGTPVITSIAGGSPECVDSKSGLIVDCENVDTVLAAIKRVCEHELVFTKENCRRQAERFGDKEKYGEYIELYSRIKG